MSYKEKTLWGFPIIESDAMPKGEVIFGPLPTMEDLKLHGSWENYIEAKKREFALICLDDETLEADTVE